MQEGAVGVVPDLHLAADRSGADAHAAGVKQHGSDAGGRVEVRLELGQRFAGGQVPHAHNLKQTNEQLVARPHRRQAYPAVAAGDQVVKVRVVGYASHGVVVAAGHRALRLLAAQRADVQLVGSQHHRVVELVKVHDLIFLKKRK